MKCFLLILAAASSQFAQREFSFTLENDVYRRYLSFSNHMEFEKELIKLCPEKIDIGAVYSAKVGFYFLFYFYPIGILFYVAKRSQNDCCHAILSNRT